MEPSLREALVVDRRVEHLDGNAAAGWAAGLHGFYAAAGDSAFANVVDEALERRAQRHLHQAGVLHLAHQREDFCARALGAARFSKPGGAASDDGRDVVPGFNVVDVGGPAPQSFLRGIGRARTRAAGEAFERGDERGLLAADKGPRALHQLDVEVEAAVENVLAQQAVLARLLDGAVEAAHRERILGAHVDDAFASRP